MNTPQTPTAEPLRSTEWLARALATAERLDAETFDLANSLAGDDTGFIAVTLHGGANRIREAARYLKDRTARASGAGCAVAGAKPLPSAPVAGSPPAGGTQNEQPNKNAT